MIFKNSENPYFYFILMLLFSPVPAKAQDQAVPAYGQQLTLLGYDLTMNEKQFKEAYKEKGISCAQTNKKQGDFSFQGTDCKVPSAIGPVNVHFYNGKLLLFVTEQITSLLHMNDMIHQVDGKVREMAEYRGFSRDLENHNLCVFTVYEKYDNFKVWSSARDCDQKSLADSHVLRIVYMSEEVSSQFEMDKKEAKEKAFVPVNL